MIFFLKKYVKNFTIQPISIHEGPPIIWRRLMIRVTKFDGSDIMLNADWIQTIETTPDTVITLTTGYQILVKNTVQEVVEAFNSYKREQGKKILLNGGHS